MSYLEMQQWANAIEDRFPKEKSSTYFMPRKPGKKNPTAKLPSKWSNVTIMNEPPAASNKIIEHPSNLLDTGIEVLKLWLKKTATLRLAQLQNLEKSSLDELIKEWPRFNDENGYQLVELDFEFMFPGKSNSLLSSFDNFISQVKPIFDTEIKDKACRNLYKIILQEGIDMNSKDCIISMLLHAILHPKRLNKSHKPTIVEAQEDFVLHVTSFNAMQEKLQKMQGENKCKKTKIQPKIVVVGVYLDGL